MSIAFARSELKAALAPLGFVPCKPGLFWARTEEVLQLVRVSTVPRMTDQLRIEMALWSPFGSGLTSVAEASENAHVRESIGDTRYTPNTWKLSRFDAVDVAWRVARIGAAFTRARDIERHYSDRHCDEWIGLALQDTLDTTRLDAIPAPRIFYPAGIEAPSEARTRALLQALEVDLFCDGWEPCPAMAGHWFCKGDDGGFAFCAYLNANSTGTLASIHYFAATLAQLKGPESNSSLSAIYAAPKYAVCKGALALQIPLLGLSQDTLDVARLRLHDEVGKFPANAIRPGGADACD